MVDVATLGIAVDSSGVRQATNDLDRFARSGHDAERAASATVAAMAKGKPGAEQFARAFSEADKNQQTYTKSANKVIDSLSMQFTRLNSTEKQWRQLQAVQKAGESLNSDAGQQISRMAGALYDMEAAQKRVTAAANDNNSGFERLANTLTRRVVFAVVAAQVRQLAAAIWNLNAELARVGDTAQRIGIGTQNVQGLEAAANNKGISSNTFFDAMIGFNRQVDLAKQGLGELGSLLRVNRVTVNDTQDAFLKVADLVARAARESDKFSILQSAGLPANREFVRLMEQGAENIKKQSEAARKFTDEQIKAAEETDRKFTEAYTNIGRVAKIVAVEIADAFKRGPNWQNQIEDNIRRSGGLPDDSLANTIVNASRNAGLTTPGASDRIEEAIDYIKRRNEAVIEGLDEFAAKLRRNIEGVVETTKQLPDPPKQTVDSATLKLQIAAEQQRLGLLGQTATALEERRKVELSLQQAAIDGVSIDKQRAETLKRLAYETALGITAIRSQADALRIEGDTYGMSAGDAAAYRAVQTQIQDAIRRGAPLREQEIDLITKEAEALKKVVEQNEKARQFRRTMDQLAGAVVDFGASIVEAALNGKNGLEAMISAAKALGSALTNIGTQNLQKGLGQFFSGGGLSGFDPVSLGIGAVGMGISLISGLFDANHKAEEALKKAKADWAAMADKAAEFSARMKGDVVSALQAVHQAAARDASDLAWAAQKAQDYAAVAKILAEAHEMLVRTNNEYLATVDSVIAAYQSGDNAMVSITKSVAASVDEVQGLIADLKYLELGGTDFSDKIALATSAAREYALSLLDQPKALSDAAEAVNKLNYTAAALAPNMEQLGLSADETAAAIANRLASAMDKLRTDSVDALTRRLNEVSGKTFLNDILDLLKEVDQFRSDAALLGGGNSAAAIDQLFSIGAQKIVDEAELAGSAFTDLIAMFPQLTGVVHESTAALDKQVEEQKRALEQAQSFLDSFTRNIQEYLDGLRSGPESPLSPQARLAAAQSQYNAQLALAQGGDQDALNGITRYSDELLNAARAMYASGTGFQNIFNQVTSQLGALPDQLSATDLIVNAINGLPQSIADYLSDYFNTLDTNTDGLLSQAEFVAGLKGMASDAALVSMFTRLDTDNSGSLTKLEAIAGGVNATGTGMSNLATATGAVGTGVDTVAVNTANTATNTTGIKTPLDYLTNINNTILQVQSALGGSTGFSVYSLLSQFVPEFSTAVSNPGTFGAIRAALNFQNQWLYAPNSGYTKVPGQTFAMGGYVTGPGTGTSDSIPAWVSNGEGVIRADRVAQYGGPSWVHDANAGRLGANDNSRLYAAVQGQTNVISMWMERLERRLASIEDRAGATVEATSRTADNTRETVTQLRAAGGAAGRGRR